MAAVEDEKTQKCSQCKNILPLSKFPVCVATLQPYLVCKTHGWYYRARQSVWAPDHLSTPDEFLQEALEFAAQDNSAPVASTSTAASSTGAVASTPQLAQHGQAWTVLHERNIGPRTLPEELARTAAWDLRAPRIRPGGKKPRREPVYPPPETTKFELFAQGAPVDATPVMYLTAINHPAYSRYVFVLAHAGQGKIRTTGSVMANDRRRTATPRNVREAGTPAASTSAVASTSEADGQPPLHKRPRWMADSMPPPPVPRNRVPRPRLTSNGDIAVISPGTDGPTAMPPHLQQPQSAAAAPPPALMDPNDSVLEPAQTLLSLSPRRMSTLGKRAREPSRDSPSFSGDIRVSPQDSPRDMPHWLREAVAIRALAPSNSGNVPAHRPRERTASIEQRQFFASQRSEEEEQNLYAVVPAGRVHRRRASSPNAASAPAPPTMPTAQQILSPNNLFSHVQRTFFELDFSGAGIPWLGGGTGLPADGEQPPEQTRALRHARATSPTPVRSPYPSMVPPQPQQQAPRSGRRRSAPSPSSPQSSGVSPTKSEALSSDVGLMPGEDLNSEDDDDEDDEDEDEDDDGSGEDDSEDEEEVEADEHSGPDPAATSPAWYERGVPAPSAAPYGSNATNADGKNPHEWLLNLVSSRMGTTNSSASKHASSSSGRPRQRYRFERDSEDDDDEEEEDDFEESPEEYV